MSPQDRGIQVMGAATLHVKNFAQIADAKIDFGDLTVLVGPQATGKSLLLQLLKLSVDRSVIAHRLKQNGFSWPRERQALAATFLGEGYDRCFRDSTSITFNNSDVLKLKGRSKDREPKVFFVPAQRVVSINNGWPRAFGEYGPGDPYVVRDFSQVLFEAFGSGLGRDGAPLFPQNDRLKAPIRRSIADSIFHGGTLALKQEGARKQLTIRYSNLPPNLATGEGVISSGADQISLPFLEWSAGQREFVPLLLGLYQMLPAGKVTKHPYYRWAIIEEPEMGLHPMAINAVMILVFELLYRGYRVALSTHAPYVLDLVWAIQKIAASKASNRDQLLLQALNNKHRALRSVANRLFEKKIKVYALTFEKNQHACTDISSLSTSDENHLISGWGGITSWSGFAAQAVAKGAA